MFGFVAAPCRNYSYSCYTTSLIDWVGFNVPC